MPDLSWGGFRKKNPARALFSVNASIFFNSPSFELVLTLKKLRLKFADLRKADLKLDHRNIVDVELNCHPNEVVTKRQNIVLNDGVIYALDQGWAKAVFPVYR